MACMIDITITLFTEQTSVSDHVTDLFIAMERLGEALFLRNGPLMMDQVITSDNIGK